MNCHARCQKLINHCSRLNSTFSRPAERLILEGGYTLYNVDIAKDSLKGTGSNGTSYVNVKGHFCPIDWTMNKENPSSAPFFSYMAPYECTAKKIVVDLQEIAEKARAFDRVTSRHLLRFDGAVFHESRVGSTLVANLLTTSGRVYSEPQPVSTAFTACMDYGAKKKSDCDLMKQKQLIRDVFYMLRRSNNQLEEKRVFFKFNSRLTEHLSLFTELFPSVPWIFLYRNPLEVMASQQKKTTCLSFMDPPASVRKLMEERSSKDDARIWRRQDMLGCAVNLAALCEIALEHLLHNGRLVNYDELPNAVWDYVLPDHFGVTTTAASRKHMKQVAGQNSKKSGNQQWKSDGQTKRTEARPETISAATTFLQPSFERLESARRTRQVGSDRAISTWAAWFGWKPH